MLSILLAAFPMKTKDDVTKQNNYYISIGGVSNVIYLFQCNHEDSSVSLMTNQNDVIYCIKYAFPQNGFLAMTKLFMIHY